MKKSPYNLIHALVATAVVLVLMVFGNGFASFWDRFIHGAQQSFTAKTILPTLLLMSGFFASLILVLWGSTFIPRFLARPRSPGSSPAGTTGVSPVDTTSELDTLPSSPIPHSPSPIPEANYSRCQAIVLALKIAIPVILVAIGLNGLGSKIIEWCTGVHPAEQEMVKCFIDPAFPIGTRVFMVLSVAIQAPLLEELLFRGIIFRGFAKKMPLVAAMLLQGCIFSLVHVNAASFAAVWFLGVAFAWLYARTRTILAPMTLHAAFNIANVLLLFFFPELAS